ncbi:flowering time control protein FCA isoform X2 [Euphorbia lathyris]|uniref:flowering time control protein FCA isoform X2 n=1 Tax=Euphorbia lathyris TaxID=212925 RepID=UPI0033136863
MENHHYQQHWQHPANHPDQHPNYYQPQQQQQQQHQHQHPQQYQQQHQHQHQHQPQHQPQPQPQPQPQHQPQHQHPHPQQHPQQLQNQQQHQNAHLYFNRPDHFVEQNNDHHFNNPNPGGYSNFNNNQMTSNEPNDSFGGLCSNGRKRGRYVSDPNGDAFHAKLYVAPVPSTSIEENIRPLFEEHGRVVQVVFPRDKRTGQQQGYCFVKYATMEEAEGAIKALNGQHTFPGEMVPIKVKFADGEKERLGVLERERFGKGEREHVGGGELVDKLYVGSINRQASKLEVEQIFSPYGHVEDVYVAKDMQKQSRGYAFIKYSHRDMAVAAIKALNGIFTMRGCDLPLIVRFADPKKRKSVGELRGNNAFSGPNIGPCSQEHMIRPAPSFGNGIGGRILPNPPYPMQEISMYSQPQAASHTVKLALGAPPIIEQALPLVKQPTAQLCHMPPQETESPKNFLQSSQQALPETTRQTQHLDQQQSVQISLESSLTGSNPPAVGISSAAPAPPLSPQTADPQECDWSEHACPDGYKYYYNCMTCESSWEKPDELTSFQQQLLKQQKVHNPSQQPHPPSIGFCGEAIDQIQKDLDHVKIQSETIPFIDPACV